MKIMLGSGRLVTLADTYGPREAYDAARLSGGRADMSQAEQMLFNIATVMVSFKAVQEQTKAGNDDPELGPVVEAEYGSPKTQRDLIGNATDTADVLLAFRAAFTDEEFDQLIEASNEVYASPKSGKPFKILR